MIHLLQVESRLAVELRLEQRPGSGKNRGCPKGGPKILVYNIFTYIIYVQDRRGLLRSAASSSARCALRIQGSLLPNDDLPV